MKKKKREKQLASVVSHPLNELAENRCVRRTVAVARPKRPIWRKTAFNAAVRRYMSNVLPVFQLDGRPSLMPFEQLLPPNSDRWRDDSLIPTSGTLPSQELFHKAITYMIPTAKALLDLLPAHITSDEIKEEEFKNAYHISYRCVFAYSCFLQFAPSTPDSAHLFSKVLELCRRCNRVMQLRRAPQVRERVLLAQQFSRSLPLTAENLAILDAQPCPQSVFGNDQDVVDAMSQVDSDTGLMCSASLDDEEDGTITSFSSDSASQPAPSSSSVAPESGSSTQRAALSVIENGNQNWSVGLIEKVKAGISFGIALLKSVFKRVCICVLGKN